MFISNCRQTKMTPSSDLQFLATLKDWRFVACLVFVAALAIRACFGMQWGETPYGKVAILDSAYFDQQAVEISNGHWLPDKVFYVPPVYPYILAVTYTLFGHSMEAVRWLQNILGSVNCLLIALIAARVFGANTGLLAGFMAALYRPFIFYDSMILKTTWDLLFTALFIISSLRTIASPRKKDAALSGIFLGIATLLRGNMIFLIPCMPLWWLLGGNREEENGSPSLKAAWFPPNRNRLNLLYAYGLGVAICILPITTSNYFLGHDLVLTGYSSGPNLWLGNNAEAMGVLVYPSDMTTKDGNMEGEEAYFRSKAEAEEGRDLKPSEVSTFWVGKAIEYVVSHPIDWALMTGDKLLFFWNNHEVSDNYDMKFLSREFGTVLNAPLLCFGIVGPLAVIGIVSAFRKRNGEAKLLMGLSLVYLGSALPFIIIDRYRLPLLVLLLPFAAHGILTMVHDLKTRKPDRLRVHGIILLVVSGLSWAPLIDTNMGLLASYTNLGAAYLKQKNLPKAKHYFEKAIEISQDSAPSFNNLGGVLFMLGENEKALSMTQKAIAIDPSYAEAYVHLGQMQTAVKDYESAIQSYQSALAINPDFALAYDKLGQLYSTVKNYRSSVESYQRAIELDPNTAKTYNNLGLAYYELKEPDNAILAYQRALDLDPDSSDAYQNLGLVYYRTKDFKKARQMFERALALRPDFLEAQNSLHRLDQEGR